MNRVYFISVITYALLAVKYLRTIFILTTKQIHVLFHFDKLRPVYLHHSHTIVYINTIKLFSSSVFFSLLFFHLVVVVFFLCRRFFHGPFNHFSSLFDVIRNPIQENVRVCLLFSHSRLIKWKVLQSVKEIESLLSNVEFIV